MERAGTPGLDRQLGRALDGIAEASLAMLPLTTQSANTLGGLFVVVLGDLGLI
jgi:hypothetical protein